MGTSSNAEIVLLYLDRGELSNDAQGARPRVHLPLFWEVQLGDTIAIEVPKGEIPKDLLDLQCELASRGRKMSNKNFSIGEGIEKMVGVCGEIRYVAKYDGLLTFADGHHQIQTELVIHGNVGLLTGNIITSYPIVIHGDVESMTTIKTQGSLTVHGHVDDKVILDVALDFLVKLGVSGTHTSIKVGGNVQIGYCNDATIVAEGNIKIEGFVFNAHVYSKKEIQVLGKHVKVGERGAVVGGVLNCLGNMTLHSAGCDLNRTLLAVGVDLLLLHKMDRLKIERTKLFKEIQALQTALGLNGNLENKAEAISFAIQKEGKESVITKMECLKSTFSKIENIKGILVRMKAQIEQHNKKISNIVAQRFMSPELWLRVGQAQSQLQKYALGPVITVIENNQVELQKSIKPA